MSRTKPGEGKPPKTPKRKKKRRGAQHRDTPFEELGKFTFDQVVSTLVSSPPAKKRGEK
jgi:hypothetical protein